MSFPATMSIGTVNIRKLDIYVSSEHSNTTTIAWDIFSIPSKGTQKTRGKNILLNSLDIEKKIRT